MVVSTNCYEHVEIGAIAYAKHQTAVYAFGEIGVCYECYKIGKSLGCSFIFLRGGYDSFPVNEIDLFLHVSNDICSEVAKYQFTNVTQLYMDYQSGFFDAAFAYSSRRLSDLASVQVPTC